MLKVDWLKVLNLAKKNWKEIAIIILLLTVIGKMRYDYKQLENTYEVSQQSLQNQIEGLQDIHAEELQRKEQALQNYRHRRQFTENKEELADQITDTFGFQYVP